MKVSEETWKKETKDVTKRLRLLERIEKVVPLARSAGEKLPALVEERVQLVADDTLSSRLTAQLGLVLARFERKLGLRK